MTDLTSVTLPPRFVVFGLECEFTQAAIDRLVNEHRLPPSAVVLPGPPTFEGVLTTPPRVALPGSQSHTVESLCQRLSIPLLRAGDLSNARTEDQLAQYGAEFALVACFNRLLPIRLIERFPRGVYNLHPSLLPDLRGPDPLFWTFKRGNGQAGVTVHRMTAKFDTGPIVAQISVPYPDGTTERELEQLLAARGVDLLATAMPEIMTDSVELSPEDHSQATWAPFPEFDDFNIDAKSTPKSAFNFVRGIRDRSPGAWYEREGTRYFAVDAIEFGNGAPPDLESEQDEHLLITGTGWIRVAYRHG